MNAVQLSFEAEGLDAHQLAELAIGERAQLYAELDLHPTQREAAEAAVRLIRAGDYLRGRR